MKKEIFKNVYGKNTIVEMVDEQDKATFITHSGTFHADEVMATVFLINHTDHMYLYRTNEVTNTKAFIYDVGYGEYDHHQSSFNKERNNKIKYASCGLVWDEVSNNIAKKLGINNIDGFKEYIENNLVMDIDRDDNGQSLNINYPIKIQSLPNLISYFNPNWDDISDENECFLKALEFANVVFNNIVLSYLSKERARIIIEEKINNSTNQVLILDEYMPWKDIVLSSNNEKARDILYAIFPSKRGGYNVVATPKEIGSFDVKKPFPEKWGGLSKEELRKISGISTINFCHKNLFICSCNTLSDAKKIVEVSLRD